MSSKRYPEEFKIAAVKQVTDRGHPAAEVASRVGVSLPTLYDWLKRYSLLEDERRPGSENPPPQVRTEASQ